ncbi:MAG: hypothetical protein QM674_20160 [Burkholderiaceae bacterium]
MLAVDRLASYLLTVGALTLPATAAAMTINFDDFPFAGGQPTAASFVPTTYQGLAWGGGEGIYSWVVSPNDATGWYGGTRQPYSHSGNNFAWNQAGTDLAITVPGGGTFDVASFWIRSWPSRGADATAQGYRSGVLVGSQSFSNNDLYQQIVTNFTAIDLFQLTLASPSSLLLDDFVINNIMPIPDVSSVPEPAAAGLLTAGLGAVALAAVGRRRAGGRRG